MSTDWSLLSRLLDESLALPAAQRATWLAALEGEAATLRPRLQALLQRGADAAAQGFLERPPDFTLPGSGDEAESLHAAGEEIGPWRLTSLLGQGGMGAVYRATDLQLQRPVAFKVMHPQFAVQHEFQQRFLQEARASAALDHPNIIRIYEFDLDNKMLYMVTEFVAGGSLRDYLKQLYDQRKFIEVSEAMALTRQIADALDYAHSQGVLHRDVKPANLFLATHGDDVTVKRFRRTRSGIELLPENADFQPIVVGPEDAFEIEGLAVGLIRNNMLM